MEIRAYDELYLSSAQNILGHAVDFAVMTLAIEPNVFGNALAVSASGKQFAQGNPRYVAGMNGCEFAREVLSDVKISYSDAEDAMYLDKSPEYWAGWALAYYQWSADTTFMDILKAVSLDDIIGMYPVYHEMDQRCISKCHRIYGNPLFRDRFTGSNQSEKSIPMERYRESDS